MTVAMDWAEFEQKLLSDHIPSRVERAELRGAFYAGTARVLSAFRSAIEAEDGPRVTEILQAYSEELAHYVAGLQQGRM